MPAFGASNEATPTTVPVEAPASHPGDLRILSPPPAESTMYPDMSLVTSTPVTPEFPKEEHINNRIADAAFCTLHFPGHTSIASSIEDILQLMGGDSILDRYQQACQTALRQVKKSAVTEQEFRERVSKEVPGKESEKWIRDTYTEGYWVNDMADYVRPILARCRVWRISLFQSPCLGAA